MIRRAFKFIYRKSFYKLVRNVRNKRLRKFLTNNDFTIISSNCIGGILYSDLGLKFLSPTVNCYFESDSFVKFCFNLKFYLSLDLLEQTELSEKYKFPVGSIGDVVIYFMHYTSFKEASIKWNERKKRVNYENIFFIMTDRDLINESDINDFLSIKGNVLFLSAINRRPESNNVVYCYKEPKTEISSDFSTFRKYEKYIDIVEWLNFGR